MKEYYMVKQENKITHSVISDVKNETYKTLLFDNESYIAALFAGQDPDGNSLDDHVTEVPSHLGTVYLCGMITNITQ